MYFDYEDKTDRKLYDIALPLVRAYAHSRFDITCKGKENIPDSGGLIVAANHISFSDPTVIMTNFPRRMHFMAKSELFRRLPLAVLLRNMNAFPVRRGQSDRAALRYACEIVSGGGVLGIFPEGRRIRSAVPDKAKTGIAFIARNTGADVLPTCLYVNPDEDVLRPKLILKYGKVIKNGELSFKGENRGAEIRWAAEYIMDSIEKLWESEHGNSSS